jgi:hypothetical protein
MQDEDVAKAEIYYFGYWGESGHYWHAPLYQTRSAIVSRVGLKIYPKIDTGFCPGSVQQAEGKANLHHVDGWTILSFWDRSGDKRGNSNSNFVVRGIWTLEDVLDAARAKFPDVMNRMKFPIVAAK